MCQLNKMRLPGCEKQRYLKTVLILHVPRNHVKSEIQRKQLLAERDHYNDFGRAKIIAELITNYRIAVSNLQSVHMFML